jgi:hypothetical protein
MSEAARKCNGPTPEELAKRAAFERLYRDWHSARAACCDPDAPEDDEAAAARDHRYSAAERALMTTPAPLPWGVFYKWELLDFLMSSDAEDGPCPDNRTLLATASIKADILSFGLRYPEE